VCLVLDFNAVHSAAFQWIQRKGTGFAYKRVFDVFSHDRAAEFWPRLNCMGVVPRFLRFVVLGARRHSYDTEMRWKNKGRQKGLKVVLTDFTIQLCLSARRDESIPFLVPLIAGLDLIRSELGLFFGHKEVFIENVKRLELFDRPDKVFHFLDRAQRYKGLLFPVLASAAVQYSDTGVGYVVALRELIRFLQNICVLTLSRAPSFWVMGGASAGSPSSLNINANLSTVMHVSDAET
jgi:hypothetical protein